MNTLYYGDNLKILREYIKDESVDLIYLDPPFNSNRNYNVLFRNETGTEAESQITAFEDTWHWNQQAELTYNELLHGADQVGQMIEAFRSFIGQNQMMAYLTMMAVRLKELHRVLKPTGSLYLHCDPTASHYLKILLDTIFGAQNFNAEIVWKRTTTKSDYKQGAVNWPHVHDIILDYFKDFNISKDSRRFNQPFEPYSQEYIEKFYKYFDANGRRYTLDNLAAPGAGSRGHPRFDFMGVTRYWRYNKEKMQRLYEEGRIVQTKEGTVPRYKRFLDEMPGVAVSDIWTDLSAVQGTGNEHLGYPTQKPVALLERILKASSNEGDVVLDPFCGCGTSIAAAQKLNRKWIGIDITHLSVGLMKYRLRDTFGLLPVGEKRSRRDQMFVEDESDLGSSSVGATEDHSAPTELNEIEDNTNYKHPAPTEPKAANIYYRVVGQPEDLDGAKELAAKDKYGFQWWILPLIGAKAFGSEAGKRQGKKGADGGIDGMIVFTDDNSGKAKKVIVSVKGGSVNVAQIRDLGHVIDREKAAIGIFLTLEKPTKPMSEEAVGKGFYHSPGWNRDYPRLQILTVEEILAGKQPDLPPNIQTFKQAARTTAPKSDQGDLFNEMPVNIDESDGSGIG